VDSRPAPTFVARVYIFKRFRGSTFPRAGMSGDCRYLEKVEKELGVNANDPAATTEDSYLGLTWAQRAAYGYLGAVLDPADATGRKNAYINTLHAAALARAIGNRRFKRALDFGCGTGRFLGFLARRSREVFAIDRTPEMLAIARSKHQIPDDHLICSRERSLPFDNGYFDLILSVYVVSCAPRPDLIQLMGELQRVCAPGGCIALLEQIDNARTLTPSTYTDAFSSSFKTPTAFPIRSGSSRYARLVQAPWFPTILRPALARREIAKMAKLQFTAETHGYWDLLLIAQKTIAASNT
jgi:ubiquinone/menaquinone biosynthesis C-methylase UbiE